MSTWYYYDNDGQKQGPITGGQLKGLAKAGQITPETVVETEEGKSAPARKISGLTFGETAQPEMILPSQPVPGTSQRYIPQGTSDDDLVVRSPSGRLVVMSEPTVYIPKNASSEWMDFFSIALDEDNGRETRGLFNVNGRQETVQFSSTDNNVARVCMRLEDGRIYTTFDKAGSAIITFTVGNETIQKKVNVVEIPIKVVVLAMGDPHYGQHAADTLPQRRTWLQERFMKPNSVREVISQLGFPDARESDDSGEEYMQRFHYDTSYPKLVIGFVDGSPRMISTRERGLSADSTVEMSARFIQHGFRPNWFTSLLLALGILTVLFGVKMAVDKLKKKSG